MYETEEKGREYLAKTLVPVMGDSAKVSERTVELYLDPETKKLIVKLSLRFKCDGGRTCGGASVCGRSNEFFWEVDKDSRGFHLGDY